MAPVALDALMERAKVARDEGRWLAAGIKAEIWNVNIDLEKHRPRTAADFMPGAQAEDDEMREFVDKVQRGEKFEVDPRAVAAFRAELERKFSGINDVGKVTNIGPSGSFERVRTNAIAGELPSRGVR
jgi:hypothetical protein